jgi:outer membrane lipoprotein-sorting protein
MTITKIAAVVALAAATLTLGACAHKPAPMAATAVKSK